MNINELITNGESYLMNTYKRLPVTFIEGKGCLLIDSEGNEYLDFLGGIACNNLGHSPAAVVKAIKDQAEKLLHVSNYFWIESQVELGKILVENSFGNKAFFCNSGAEANEGAIKLARKYAFKKYGAHKNEIIAMKGSFHGRTLTTLTATDNEKYKEGYGPLPSGIKFVDFNDIEEIKKVVSQNTCGIIMEPIQGEGGVTPASIEFVKAVKDICVENDILLIFDEIQCGIARTGKLFAYEHFNVEPDIMTLAKALAGGVSIGAIVATDEAALAWQPGDHGTTFGGNPLACAAGVANMNVIIKEKMWEKAAITGEYFEKKLLELVDKFKFIKKVKGKGLMLGLELEIEGGSFVQKAFNQRIIINCTAGNVLRFVPPLIIEEKEIDQLCEVLHGIFMETEGY
ncbi:aspartate aminotransferase family protein [Alkaliphilus peptidifermentans]|uniref:Acetylornithine aminotransferase n=1 Tax=Alkaliphilus peptidifermentans DSM 18978 TaxID=1120976 RepID=A0A1G5HPW8_9FIRM|nr:aspartate aminotransferase family protein [Alkaliphilus peptidifermentans]SCY65350.1 acetylornithine aminotransferase apoenzyme [Alkaliphilus peptidifermentans DSM 18978]